MKTFLLIFLCLIAAIQSYKVIQTDSVINEYQKTNLGFINSTGGVTDQMLKTYVKVIGEAANLYKENVKANLEYIKQNLDNAYGTGSQFYHIYIQTNLPEKQSYSLWTSVKRAITGLNRVNPVNPNWSYLILRTYSYPDISTYSYLSNGIYGTGMNQGARLAVKNIIETFEPTIEGCTCDKESVTNIRKSLESYFSCYQFNVICDSNGSTSAFVQTQGGMYGTFKNKCYYTIYKNL